MKLFFDIDVSGGVLTNVHKRAAKHSMEQTDRHLYKKDFFTLKHFNYSKAMICSSERPFIFNLSLIITKLTKNPPVQNIREYHWVIKLRRYAIQMKRKFVQITMNNGIWIVHESHGNKSRDTKINLCSKLSFTIQEFMSFVLK